MAEQNTAPSCTINTSQDSSAPPEPDLARVDVADLMEGNRVMHLTLNDQVYTLRITRAQKLILTK